VKLFDKSNALIGFYPATVGSEEKPSPSGTLKVTEIDPNPTYRYNPDYQSRLGRHPVDPCQPDKPTAAHDDHTRCGLSPQAQIRAPARLVFNLGSIGIFPLIGADQKRRVGDRTTRSTLTGRQRILRELRKR
jgi:hypothetical protein